MLLVILRLMHDRVSVKYSKAFAFHCMQGFVKRPECASDSDPSVSWATREII